MLPFSCAIVFIDDTRLLFRVLSMTKVEKWYTVSIQCCYCECPDYASKCKHLMGIRLIIERHMPMLKECLPVIDHAKEMHGKLSG